MVSTKLVSHRVAYTKECIGKCHTSHSRSSSHLFSCLGIMCSILICCWKIFKYILHSLKCKTVSIISSHNRCVSFKCVRKCIYTRRCCKSLRLVHAHISIDNSHLRKQLIVSKRILYSSFFISDNCERSNL